MTRAEQIERARALLPMQRERPARWSGGFVTTIRRLEAGPNDGDCASHARARLRGAAPLCKGDGVNHTDPTLALAAL